MKKRHFIPLIIIAVSLVIYIIAILNRNFADFYVINIFPYISNAASFVSGIFPFSIGEVLIIIGIFFIITGIPTFLILLIFMKKTRSKVFDIFSSISLWIVAFIVTTTILNCYIMYRCTPFSEKYFTASEEHSREELIELYEKLINEANILAKQVKRDENGIFVLTADVDECAKTAMKNIADKYPQLKGYYPDAKPVLNSFFMSQSGLLGVFFSFSMEANYNKDMYEINLPDTVCHEYAHLKGIIQEDEAGFIAFLACSESDNTDFRYSGYLDALEYVHNEIYKNDIVEAFELSDTISDEVTADWFKFVPMEYWEENKDKEIISTETVDTISDIATDTSLKVNGVEDGIESYCRVVNLLLDYFAQK